MIAGDKNMLQASLTQGVLKIQTRLVTLYTNNLRALGIGGTRMSGFAAMASGAKIHHNLYPYNENMMYVYYFFDLLAFTMAVFCVCQATIVRVFGPTLALSGETPEAVMNAIRNMESEQTFVFKIAATAIISVMIAFCILGWMQLDHGIAAMDTVIYVGGIIMLVKRGRQTYNMFKWEEPSSTGATSDTNADGASGAVGPDGAPIPRSLSASGLSNEELVQHASSKVRGVLFWREPLMKGGLFREVYVVLRKGKLDFHRSQAEFEEHGNPINSAAIKIWQYDVEQNIKKFSHDIIGQTDFTLTQVMTSKYALRDAAKKYKFALMPKVFSELAPLDVVELMATDEESYKLWTNALKKCIRAHEELGGRDGVLAATKNTVDTKKIIKVENALVAANTQRAVAL